MPNSSAPRYWKTVLAEVLLDSRSSYCAWMEEFGADYKESIKKFEATPLIKEAYALLSNENTELENG